MCYCSKPPSAFELNKKLNTTKMHHLSVTQLRFLHQDGCGELLGICHVRVPLHDNSHKVRGEDVAQVNINLFSVVLIPWGILRQSTVRHSPRRLLLFRQALKGELLITWLCGVIRQRVSLPIAIRLNPVTLPVPGSQPFLAGVRLSLS